MFVCVVVGEDVGERWAKDFFFRTRLAVCLMNVAMSEECGSGNPPLVTHPPSRPSSSSPSDRRPTTDQFQRLLKHLRNVVRRICNFLGAASHTRAQTARRVDNYFSPSLTSDSDPAIPANIPYSHVSATVISHIQARERRTNQSCPQFDESIRPQLATHFFC